MTQPRLPSKPAAARPHPLDRFPVDRCGVIEEVLGDEEDIRRLQAMGVCRGRRVMVVQHGDPLIVRVLGSRIGVSARLASCVLARVEDDGGGPR